MVPVNMRTESDTTALGNYFGLVAVLLPLGIENPVERLYEVKRRMTELKGSRQALVALGVLAAVGMAPKRVQQEILDLLASRASAVMTNVPGPQQPLHMAGARLKEVVFWVPQTGTIGMGISILSYDGGVQFGIVTDRNLIADPEPVAQLFARQFEQLLLLSPCSAPGTRPPCGRRVDRLCRQIALNHTGRRDAAERIRTATVPHDRSRAFKTFVAQVPLVR